MRLDLFDLNLLRALDALLCERSVTRAAQKLHVTQQAMSGSLKRLREHFDDELLIRVGRGLELTPQGEAFIIPVREVMLQIALALEATPNFNAAESERRFRIAMSDYSTVVILPHLISYLSQHAPGIVCEIQLINTVVFQDLEAGKLDFYLLPSNWRLFRDRKPEGVHSLPIFEDDLVCVIDAANTSVGDTLSMEQYLEMPHNMVRLGAGVRSVVEDAWTRAGLAPRIVATTTSFVSLLFMIPGTKLVATVQRRLATKFLPILPIRIVECPLSNDRLSHDLSWHFRNDHDPAHRFLREAFGAVGKSVGGFHKCGL